MTEMWAPMSGHPEKMKWYLSTGKSLSVVVRVEDGVFRVWEMVCGDNYYWREWEHHIVLGSEIQYPSSSIYPVGWLQQMEVLVFKGWSKHGAFDVFYVVIATGEIGWIAPVSSSEEKGESYTSIGPFLPHKNTLVQLEGYF
ncbi:Unknown protein [Striga hermonthica]|uniref:Uncharacterized protein n=1 Tax=Striga hermonthica TaxID=68872 RepID=A0A9N7MLV0_STRHE|nr:Unknown protein [Striga hermonthica]